MKTKLAWLMVVGLSCHLTALAAAPILRVVRAADAGAPLLRNGDFETVTDGKPDRWAAAPQGCRLAAGEGRNGSRALVCQNPSGQGWFGASQVLQLNRTNTAPLVVRGWSKAENVSGGADNNYSLYVDLVYDDGTPLWGQTANFRCGTHDWERREFVILPDKPVKTLTLHCLFRGHAGKVWFDDVGLEEMNVAGGAALFQGVSVVANGLRPPPTLPLGRLLTNAVAAGCFLARDVAMNSDFFPFENGACPELGLQLRTESTPGPGQVAIQGRVSDTTGRDRALTLVFALPIDPTGWRWGDDLRRSRLIQGKGEFVNQVSVRCGSTGTLSLYPLGAIWNESNSLACAIDMAQPAQYRVGCQAGLQCLFLAYDFGLVQETARFPGAADFRFVVFDFDPRSGFRAALQKYMEMFPACFEVRTKEQGLWMPFTDVSTVQGWQDFGFRYHEGNNNVRWDDDHAILSFRYTEPMTWWMAMKKDLPRTPAEAARVRDAMAQDRSGSSRRMAEVSRLAAMFDESGQPCLRFEDTPWCNGAVWSLNPNPFLPVTADPNALPATSTNRPLFNAATVYWNDAVKQQLYGPAAKGQQDGEYLDSLEGYVTADLNFRRDHFRATTVPLTFSSDSFHPALFKGLAVFEFTRWIAEDVHRMGKLMFANGVPYRFSFLCPWLDVLGTETDWLRAGKYQPASITQMDFWRALSGAKPYLLLMNTDYDQFTPDLVEKYFQRCLFYGMWPGMFSHNAADHPYWQNPKWYNRDRPLFKRYIPLIKRVAESGWQPVTEARVSNDRLLVERFGAKGTEVVCFTVFNDTTQPQAGRLQIDAAGLGLTSQTLAVRDLLTGEERPFTAAGLDLVLQPQEVKVFELRK
jgi:hypothetical protein